MCYRQKHGWKVRCIFGKLQAGTQLLGKAETDSASSLPDHCSFLLPRRHSQGRDLIHDIHSPVRISEYFVKYGDAGGLLPGGYCERGGIGTRLTGLCRFTVRAESHAGFCHGGAMTSVIDDAIGWCAFCATGCVKPWSGFTVRVNASLLRPVPVGSLLLVEAEISNIERRKIFVAVQIVDPATLRRRHRGGVECGGGGGGKDENDDVIVHAKGDGMVVLNRGVLPCSAD